MVMGASNTGWKPLRTKILRSFRLMKMAMGPGGSGFSAVAGRATVGNGAMITGIGVDSLAAPEAGAGGAALGDTLSVLIASLTRSAAFAGADCVGEVSLAASCVPAIGHMLAVRSAGVVLATGAGFTGTGSFGCANSAGASGACAINTRTPILVV